MANIIKVLVLIDKNEILSITTDQPDTDVHVIVTTYEFGKMAREVITIDQMHPEEEPQPMAILANRIATVDPEWIKAVTTAPKWDTNIVTPDDDENPDFLDHYIEAALAEQIEKENKED